MPVANAADCEALVAAQSEAWRAGRVADVVAALQTEELRCADQPRFNRVLGEALLASGRPSDALMPLERAVTQLPGDQASWRALAQSWLALGDRDAALAASQAAEQNRPLLPVDTPAERRGSWQVTLEAGRGHDSNVGLTTGESRIAVPALGGAYVTLGPASRQQGDDYWATAVTAEASWMLSPSLSMQWSVGDTRRQYDHKHRFSSEQQTLASRFDYGSNWGVWSFSAHGDHLWEEKQNVRYGLGANVGWRPLDGRSFWPAVTLDVTRFRYEGSFRGLDGFVERVLSFSQSTSLGLVTVGWVAQVGQDTATVSRADGNSDMIGGRLYATGPLTPSLEWFSWYDHLDNHYDHLNPAFLVYRHDALDSLNAGLSLGLGHGFSVRGQVGLSHQHSSVPLYSYRRADTSLTVSYSFGS